MFDTPSTSTALISIGPSPCGAARHAGAEYGELEVIDGFVVHPFASRFPLIEGGDFVDLVESIRVAGTVTAVEFHNGLLTDGRNRVRAVAELRRRGCHIELPTVEWQPTGDETIEGHIFAVNVYRRHLTDDQRVMFAIEMLPIIRAARAAKQAATRFGGTGKDPATVLSVSPAALPAGPRSPRDRAAATTVGQLAVLAKVSIHKATHAVALANAVAAGVVDETEIIAVRQGKKLLRDASPAKKKRGHSKPASRGAPPPAAETFFDDPASDAEPPALTEAWVDHVWDQIKQAHAIADHRELRRLFQKVITKEQRQFDT